MFHWLHLKNEYFIYHIFSIKNGTKNLLPEIFLFPFQKEKEMQLTVYSLVVILSLSSGIFISLSAHGRCFVNLLIRRKIKNTWRHNMQCIRITQSKGHLWECFITDHAHSMREGNVFTGVHKGVPIPQYSKDALEGVHPPSFQADGSGGRIDHPSKKGLVWKGLLPLWPRLGMGRPFPRPRLGMGLLPFPSDRGMGSMVSMPQIVNRSLSFVSKEIRSVLTQNIHFCGVEDLGYFFSVSSASDNISQKSSNVSK